MFGAKVQIAVLEKGLDFELVMVSFDKSRGYEPKHPEVLRINPKRQVPVLIHGELEIFDSTQIFEYLEDLQPDPALWPKGPVGRARARLLEHESDEVYFPHVIRQPRISFVPGHFRGHDVEDGKPVDPVRVVESHAIGDATAAIMSDERKARKPKPLHHSHHVLRHGALRIGRMVWRGDRAAALPIAAKISADNGKVVRKQRRDAVPHQVSLRKAVQQENRRAQTQPAHEDTGLVRLNNLGFKVISSFGLCSFPHHERQQGAALVGCAASSAASPGHLVTRNLAWFPNDVMIGLKG